MKQRIFVSLFICRCCSSSQARLVANIWFYSIRNRVAFTSLGAQWCSERTRSNGHILKRGKFLNIRKNLDIAHWSRLLREFVESSPFGTFSIWLTWSWAILLPLTLFWVAWWYPEIPSNLSYSVILLLPLSQNGHHIQRYHHFHCKGFTVYYLPWISIAPNVTIIGPSFLLSS